MLGRRESGRDGRPVEPPSRAFSGWITIGWKIGRRVHCRAHPDEMIRSDQGIGEGKPTATSPALDPEGVSGR